MKKLEGYVGLFFHSFNEEGLIEHQGLVEYQLPDGRLICLMFEWFMGEPNNQQTFFLSETDGWQFYTTEEHWNFNCERLKKKEKFNLIKKSQTQS